MAKAAIRELAKTRPYSARVRVLEALKARGGSIGYTSRDLRISEWTLRRVMTTLGLQDIAKELRADRARTNRAANRLAWSIRGNLLKSTPEYAAKLRAMHGLPPLKPKPIPPVESVVRLDPKTGRLVLG